MTHSFERWRAQGKSFSFRGHVIFFQHAVTTGAGPQLLLVHGLPTSSWDYHRLWPALEARCASLLAPDMLGFGFSAKPAAHAYSISEQADMHEELLRAHGITRYKMIAHDYGATVGQELLARHAEREAAGDTSLRLEGVCLLNGGLFPETHRPLLIQRLMLTALGPFLSRLLTYRSFARSFSQVFGAQTQPSEDELKDFWRLIIHNDGKRELYRLFHYIPERRQRRARWVGALRETRVPLLLVNGPVDPVSGAHMVERYRELVPNPDVVSLPGIGHYPHVEDPEGVLRALEKLLV
jgi:pimeloyl-ACP methyl ester carboxylesterase